MLCCICKEKEATVHLTQIAGDKMQKVDLCEDCAKTKGVNDPTGFSLADLLLGLGASQEIEQSGGGVEIKCARCGFTQADFKKAGRLGCPECYKTFSDALDGLLRTTFVFHVDDVTGVERLTTIGFESFEYSDHDILEPWMRGIHDNRVARVEGNAAERFELVGNAAEIFPELVRQGRTPDVVTDQTSAHDALNGYIPEGFSLAEAAILRDEIKQTTARLASSPVA